MPLDRLRLTRSGQRNAGSALAHGAKLVENFAPGRREPQRPGDPVEKDDTQCLLQRRHLRDKVRLVGPKERAAAVRRPASAVARQARAWVQSKGEGSQFMRFWITQSRISAVSFDTGQKVTASKGD